MDPQAQSKLDYNECLAWAEPPAETLALVLTNRATSRQLTKDYQGALRALNNLYNPDKLTEYEQANVLNYIGFIYYNMEDIPNAIRTYEKMIAIPSLEPQMGKQTTYTLAQLYTMEEQYQQALSTLDKWFILEPNPAPDPFILKAQNLYQLSRYKDMIEPIENAMRIARERNKPVKEDWYVLLNFAYFQDENYKMVRDIQKILLETWPKKRIDSNSSDRTMPMVVRIAISEATTSVR